MMNDEESDESVCICSKCSSSCGKAGIDDCDVDSFDGVSVDERNWLSLSSCACGVVSVEDIYFPSRAPLVLAFASGALLEAKVKEVRVLNLLAALMVDCCSPSLSFPCLGTAALNSFCFAFVYFLVV
jgi:hypothetical protein